jgi:hypothetical protein
MKTNKAAAEVHKVATTKKTAPARFDYVKFDDVSTKLMIEFKVSMSDVERKINNDLASPRHKALALTAFLEEVYCWIGKALRDDQVERVGKVELQEERNNE